MKFIASFYEKLCLSNGKYYNERTVNDSGRSLTKVFEVNLAMVNDESVQSMTEVFGQ